MKTTTNGSTISHVLSKDEAVKLIAGLAGMLAQTGNGCPVFITEVDGKTSELKQSVFMINLTIPAG